MEISMTKTYPPHFQIVEILHNDHRKWRLLKDGFLNGQDMRHLKSPLSTNNCMVYDLPAVRSVSGLSATTVKRIDGLQPGNLLKIGYMHSIADQGLRRVPDEELAMLEHMVQLEQALAQVQAKIAACIPPTLLAQQSQINQQMRKIRKQFDRQMPEV
jgi:hypothetical protein